MQSFGHVLVFKQQISRQVFYKKMIKEIKLISFSCCQDGLHQLQIYNLTCWNNNKKTKNKKPNKQTKTCQCLTPHLAILVLIYFQLMAFSRQVQHQLLQEKQVTTKPVLSSWFCRSLPGQQGVLPTVPVVQLMAISNVNYHYISNCH